METPLHIANVHNMRLENFHDNSNERPIIVALFSCKNEVVPDCIQNIWMCCAAVQLSRLHNITLKGITVRVQNYNMSSIILRSTTSIHIQSVTSICSSSSSNNNVITNIGILLYEANFVEVTMSSALNCSYGLLLHNTTNSFITSTPESAVSNNGIGIYCEHSANTTIVTQSSLWNSKHGMYFYCTLNTIIINATVTYNGFDGILLSNTNNTSILNPTVVSNGMEGILLSETNYTNISNPNVKQNKNTGIYVINAENTHMTNVSLAHNGISGLSTLSGNILIAHSLHTFICNSAFVAISTQSPGISTDPKSLPAVIMLYNSSLNISACTFSRNSISAVKLFQSNITASGDVIISKNRVLAGTAFILVQNSILTLLENSHIYFIGNHATNTGGVFYIANNVHYRLSSRQIFQTPDILEESTCFLHTEGSRSHKKLVFANNSAEKGGDILYGGQVAYGWDGDMNCLLSFKNISNISQSGLSLITSDPSQVCLCNGTGQPDCLIVADPAPHSIYPGQSINISAVIVGQDFGTVAGSVYAHFLEAMVTGDTPQLDTHQRIQGVTQEKCNQLKYTSFSPGEASETLLILTPDVHDRSVSPEFESSERDQEWQTYYRPPNLNRLIYSNHLVSVNITFLPCPAGFMLTSDPPFKCDCNQMLQGLKGVKCYIQDLTIGRSGLIWLGTLKEGNGTVVTSEYCLFDYCNKENSNVTLSDPDSQCNYNHSGTLCGGCQPGLSLALGSAQCLQCSNKYLALLIPFALAGPALVFFIKLLDLTVSQGTINGLIFYANLVKANEYIFLPQKNINTLTLFIAWLNLDLGVETCFFHGLSAYTKTWLQFVFPLYIWSIAGLIIILAKYSDWVAKVMGNNSVPVLATLFLLSYAKLFRTLITVLSYTMLYSSQGHKAVWSADGNIEYLGPKHAPLFAVAVAVLLFLWLPYTLLLFLGQWLHRCNCRLIDRTLVKLKPFLDSHYGPLKGKHHYWFGTLLLVRVVILLMAALIPTNHASIIVFCSFIFATVLNYFGLITYRNITVAMFDVSFFINLALLCVTHFYTKLAKGNQAVAAYTLIGTAFVQFLGLLTFKVFAILKRSRKIRACLQRRHPAEGQVRERII